MSQWDESWKIESGHWIVRGEMALAMTPKIDKKSLKVTLFLNSGRYENNPHLIPLRIHQKRFYARLQKFLLAHWIFMRAATKMQKRKNRPRSTFFQPPFRTSSIKRLTVPWLYYAFHLFLILLTNKNKSQTAKQWGGLKKTTFRIAFPSSFSRPELRASRVQ